MLPVIKRRNDSLIDQRDLFGDLDKMFSSFWPAQSEMTNMIGGLDVYEDKNSIHVDCDLPGFNKEEIELSLEDDILRITAEHKETKEQKKEDSYYLRERRCNSFSRSVRLPQNIMHEKVAAEYANGVLHIAVEKQPEKKPQSITIK